MKDLRYILILLALLMLSSWDYSGTEKVIFDESTPLMLLKSSLGKEIPSHYLKETNPKETEIGRQLIFEGRAQLEKGKSDYISKFYVCTSCHNTVKENIDLGKVDQEARLDYAIANNLPYLQASTFWGVVNREIWYNDDYVKKYGDLVIKASKSLKESIQLCAQECSQGRVLEDWEMQAMLAYLKSIEVRLGDIGLTDSQLASLNSNELDQSEKLRIIDEHYLVRSPATFSEPPADKKEGYGMKGIPERGKAIYELGCQHCHKEDGVSDLVLDNAKKTFNWLKKNITADSQYSIYQIVRQGTYASHGHREYMPHYTQEKMSDQQLEDLRSYIVQMAR